MPQEDRKKLDHPISIRDNIETEVLREALTSKKWDTAAFIGFEVLETGIEEIRTIADQLNDPELFETARTNILSFYTREVAYAPRQLSDTVQAKLKDTYGEQFEHYTHIFKKIGIVQPNKDTDSFAKNS